LAYFGYFKAHFSAQKMRSQEAPEVDGQMRVLRERMDTLSELMDELMLRQVGSPVEIHGESGNITGIYREIHGKSIGNLEKRLKCESGW
jgi:hypothetical protein